MAPQITARMMNVARTEGLAINEASMKALVEVCALSSLDLSKRMNLKSNCS